MNTFPETHDSITCLNHIHTAWTGNHLPLVENIFSERLMGINPGQTKSLNIIFGPGQGCGNYVDFEYDSSREYFLLIEESFGSMNIPLELTTKASN